MKYGRQFDAELVLTNIQINVNFQHTYEFLSLVKNNRLYTNSIMIELRKLILIVMAQLMIIIYPLAFENGDYESYLIS